MSNASESFHPFGSAEAYHAVSETLARVQGYAPQPKPIAPAPMQDKERESLK